MMSQSSKTIARQYVSLTLIKLASKLSNITNLYVFAQRSIQSCAIFTKEVYFLTFNLKVKK